MKKIAFIGLNRYPIPCLKGGAIEALITILLEQNEIEHRFDITVYTIQDEELSNVNYKYTRIIQIPETGLLSVLFKIYKAIRRLTRNHLPMRSVYMKRINRNLLRFNYDVVFFASSNELVAQLDKRVTSKVLYGVYSDYLTKISYGIEAICKRITAFVANEYLCKRLREELNITKDQTIELIGGININPIDLNLIPEYRTQTRKKYQIDSEEILVVYTGRLSPEKGPLELIKAIQEVPQCKLLIIGGSNFSKNDTTDYIKELRREADKTQGRVVFTGYVPSHDDVLKMMSAADIGVVPSICNEAASGALLEFRLVNVPTIISNKGGMYLNAGRSSIVVDCNENYIDNLAKAINSLSINRNQRIELSKIAREGVEKYSEESYFKQFVEIINTLFK